MKSEIDSDVEIAMYGLKVIVYNAITIGLIILISYGLHNLLYSIYFLMSFCYLRIKFGGYHCKTYIGCLLMTNLLYLITFMLSQNIYYCIFVSIAFIPMIFYYFYILNNLKYKIKLDSIIFLILGIFSIYNYYSFVAWSSGMLLAGILFVINNLELKQLYHERLSHTRKGYHTNI